MSYPKPKVEDLLEVDSFKGKKYVNGAKVANVMRLSWKNVTVEQARAASEHYSELYSKHASPNVDVRMNASMNIPKLGYRTGFMASAGEHVPFYSYTDYDSWKGLVIGKEPFTSKTVLPNFDLYVYQFPKQPNAGKGFDKETHCFYFCIITIFENGKISGIKGPKAFKKRFKLKPEDGVPVDLMPIIEKTLAISITVIGDHVYTSQSNSPRKIKLMLKNGHYTIVHPEERQTYCYWSPHDRIPITRYIDETGQFIYFDGKKRFELTDKDMQILQYHPKDAKYVVVRRKNNDEATLESDWKEFKQLADKLKQKSKGRINLYQTGDYKNTALKLFHDFGYSLDIVPEEMEYDESIWHEECYNGGIIKADISMKQWKRLYKFDISSMYPSIMASGNTVPIKRGEFKITSEEIKSKKFFPKGIFRAIVEEGSKLFAYNKHNKYWNHELNNAKNKLNLKVTIIEDGQNNFLEYTADKCIPLKILYSKFVNFLYPLKQYEKDEDIKKAIKAIITVLWGAHSEKYRIKKVVNKNVDGPVKFVEDENCTFESIESLSGNRFRIIQTRYTDIYKGEFPRVKSFITSQGRCLMYELLHESIDEIKTIRTDGFFCTHKEFPSVLKKDAQLGSLVYEGYYEDVVIDKTMTNMKAFKFIEA